MFAFSCTAPTLTPEQEERELADLDSEEQDNILDDVFGRNAEKTEELNRREITQQQLDDFESALKRIPLAEQSEYQMALIHCPELLQSETSPRLFLICEARDHVKAAKRLVEYWRLRVQIFGTTKSFLPISVLEGGALEGDDEVIAMMREFPYFRHFLPNDSHGRTVISSMTSFGNPDFANYKRDVKLKYVWYFLHVAMKRDSTVLRGLVYIATPSLGHTVQTFDRIYFKRLTAIHDCFPFTLRAVHHTSNRLNPFTMFLSYIKFFMDKETRFRTVLHQRLCAEGLERYGFVKSGLSTALNGTLQINEDWVNSEVNSSGIDHCVETVLN